VKAVARAGSAEARLERLGEQVWQASEGNPFVAVQMMQERDVKFAPDDGGDGDQRSADAMGRGAGGRWAALKDDPGSAHAA